MFFGAEILYIIDFIYILAINKFTKIFFLYILHYLLLCVIIKMIKCVIII